MLLLDIACARTFELHSIVPSIRAAAGEKLLMRAALHNAPTFNRRDLVSVFDGRKAVRDDDRRAVGGQTLERDS